MAEEYWNAEPARLPDSPHEARSFRLFSHGRLFLMKGSSLTRHPADTEGKKPNFLPLAK